MPALLCRYSLHVPRQTEGGDLMATRAEPGDEGAGRHRGEYQGDSPNQNGGWAGKHCKPVDRKARERDRKEKEEDDQT